MCHHLLYGRARDPLLVTNTLVGGNSNCLNYLPNALQAGRCRRRQGADDEPIRQKDVLNEVVAINDRCVV